jgi:hypothetical protein
MSTDEVRSHPGAREKQVPVLRQQLIGSWELIDWKVFRGAATLDPHLGPADNCGGLLIYSADGLMSVTLSVKDRPVFTDESLDGGTPEEKAHAYETITCYSGGFDFDEDTHVVTHHVRYATFPNFVGRDLNRVCILEGDTLKLDTPPMLHGGENLASYILWQRVK